MVTKTAKNMLYLLFMASNNVNIVLRFTFYLLYLYLSQYSFILQI